MEKVTAAALVVAGLIVLAGSLPATASRLSKKEEGHLPSIKRHCTRNRARLQSLFVLMPGVTEQLENIRAKDKGRPRKHVTILGAGIAGLIAGYELNRLGHVVTILEGSNRVGGRAFTYRFKDGQYHELGAMRIPASHDYTRHYIQEMGLQLRPFITAHKTLSPFYFIKGIRTTIKDAPKNLFPLFALSPTEQFVAAAAVAPAVMGLQFADLIASLTTADKQALFSEGPMTESVAQIERTSLGEFLEAHAHGPDTRELIGVTTGLEVWWDKALSMFLRDEIVNTGDGLEEIVGGTDLLPSTLAQKIPQKAISLNVEITGIEAGDQPKLKVMSQENGQGTVEADYVLCTIPFPVLRRIELVQFSTRKLRAIRDINYASSTKVLLHCKQRFWELNNGIFGGASLSDLITRSTYYPSDNVAARPPQPLHLLAELDGTETMTAQRSRLASRSINTTFALASTQGRQLELSSGPGVLVGSYNWGRDARRLGELQPVNRAECVIRTLTNIHPEIRDSVDDAASMFWDENKWAGAAFSFMRPNDMRDYYVDAIAPEGRVFFAGEHCSMDQAWMQGAAISALRAVEDIVSR